MSRSTPMSPEAQSLYRLLADGGWHPAETIRAQLAATIAPGKALRRYRNRQASRERAGRLAIEHTEAEAIAMGQNEIAGNMMRTWCEHDLRGEAPDVGMVRWRDLDVTALRPPDRSDEPELVGEALLRAVVAQETAAALDEALSEFQKGMQGFLIEQFAAIEALIGGPPPLRTWPPSRSDDG